MIYMKSALIREFAKESALMVFLVEVSDNPLIVVDVFAAFT